MSNFDKDSTPGPIASITEQAAAAVAPHIPAGYGFIILVTPFSNAKTIDGGYVSNCDRASAIKILKTILFRWGINDEWINKAE